MGPQRPCLTPLLQTDGSRTLLLRKPGPEESVTILGQLNFRKPVMGSDAQPEHTTSGKQVGNPRKTGDRERTDGQRKTALCLSVITQTPQAPQAAECSDETAQFGFT